jgi:multidrug efflux pump subunit AcrA (membrane-fusion protein)
VQTFVGDATLQTTMDTYDHTFQAKITRVAAIGGKTSVTAVLSGPGYGASARYVLEIVTEPIEALSVPNEAIMESDGKHVVYVEAEKGRYVPREIRLGIQGELYTQVLDGLTAGQQVVTFGSSSSTPITS